MATKASRSLARMMMAPAVTMLMGWMLVPLIMTLWFSFTKYLPLRGDSIERGLDWVGFANYSRFLSSSAFWPSVQTTLVMVGGVLLITVVLGVLLAMLLDQPMWGQGVVRILIIAPFFVMPTVSALVWKEHDDGPCKRHFCPPVAVFRVRACGLASGCLAQLYSHNRVMAVAALCNFNSAHINPVAGQ